MASLITSYSETRRCITESLGITQWRKYNLRKFAFQTFPIYAENPDRLTCESTVATYQSRNRYIQDNLRGYGFIRVNDISKNTTWLLTSDTHTQASTQN